MWPVGVSGCAFGTLLGPEATGFPVPFLRGWGFCLFLVSWACSRVALWCGRRGVTGLLFENYIVDASIFYKKQFPR